MGICIRGLISPDCFLACSPRVQALWALGVWAPGCELSTIWGTHVQSMKSVFFGGGRSCVTWWELWAIWDMFPGVKSLSLWTISVKSMMSLTSVLFLRGGVYLAICVTVWYHCLSMDWGSECESSELLGVLCHVLWTVLRELTLKGWDHWDTCHLCPWVNSLSP